MITPLSFLLSKPMVTVNVNFVAIPMSFVEISNNSRKIPVIYRDHSVHVPTQWETTLHCSVVSHWLGAYTESCLNLYSTSGPQRLPANLLNGYINHASKIHVKRGSTFLSMTEQWCAITLTPTNHKDVVFKSASLDIINSTAVVSNVFFKQLEVFNCRMKWGEYICDLVINIVVFVGLIQLLQAQKWARSDPILPLEQYNCV